MKKPNGYWTKERCREESLKYNSITDFKKVSAYSISVNKGWLDYVCSHMFLHKPRNYWTYERCIEEALKYNNKNDLFKNSKGVVTASKKNGWYDEICSHMEQIETKSYGYWTYEKCKEESLKYNTKKEFKDKAPGAVKASKKNGWYDKVCSHMIVLGNKTKRCIYVAEFSDNFIYVGLTFNYNKRIKEHLLERFNTSVYKHHIKSKLTPIFTQLTDYIDVNEASILEGIKLKEYIEKGFNTLNKIKCGGVGWCK